MLGFRPLSPDILRRRATDNPDIPLDILEINSKLEDYRVLDELFDYWLVLATQDINIVYKWRLEAEEKMQTVQAQSSSGKSALTPDEVNK